MLLSDDAMRQQHKPDAIVTTYPLSFPLAALALNSPVYPRSDGADGILVSVHSLRFNEDIDRCLAPTEGRATEGR